MQDLITTCHNWNHVLLGYIYCIVFNIQIKMELTRFYSSSKKWIDFATETLCFKPYFDHGMTDIIQIVNYLNLVSSVFSTTCLKRLMGYCKSVG
jgi:hypothetical protein